MSGLRGQVRRFLQRPGAAGLARHHRLLADVTGREAPLRALDDAGLRAAAQEATDDAAACAVAREAARRGLGERPYDVQVLGALAMLSGQVAEMATGEGKTLSGAMAAAAYALRGRSVHVMSVNDYLARRDAEWMAPVYGLLGVGVGWIGQSSTPEERRRAYAADVTYAPASEIGFDVLRGRLCTDADGLIAPDPDVALIDEADSVLVDEALVPLVLAGASRAAETDHDMARIARGLRPGLDYEIGEDHRTVTLTDRGARAVERALGGTDLYAAENLDLLTQVNVAVHARALLRRDVDYIVRDGRVHLISASRGRVARLQRWPDGLQAAVEAKEGLEGSESGEVLDSITTQSLVRRYPTVCGMTGTAVAAGAELREFYGLEIAVIPPNRPCVREDEPDRLYRSIDEKEAAVVCEVAEAHATGQPVLIGTRDIAESERLVWRLGRAGLPCVVLNAKNDAEEASIIAEAGACGAVTVSTQMAGRGTDIRLGGSTGDRDRIAALGGLRVIGTGRHHSSRLDHQLRGRAGRQGDPGSSVFFVSMEDDLITATPRAAAWPGTPGEDGRMPADRSARWAVEHAQRAAEGASLEIHRNTWRYSTVLEGQRAAVLRERDRVLRTDAALADLSARCPARAAGLAGEVDRGLLVRAARQISLYHLDRAWAGHLARAADVREGIGLRALGHGSNPFVQSLDPLDEFNREVIGLFDGLLEDAAARSAAAFETAPLTSGGIDLDAAGLKRPTSTWTYLVRDNPFGSDLDRAMRRFGRIGGR